MSRIGNRVLTIPAGVTVTNEDNTLTVKGPKGELKETFNKNLKIVIEGETIKVERPNDTKEMKSIHGTTNALISNMLIGVSEGFVKELTIIGVGYRCNVSGKNLELNVGYSHPVKVEVPATLTVEAPSNTEIKISGINRQEVSEFAANVRKIRQPEPYKGKGIRYKDEYVRRKEGKKASK